jgi:single-strand DNA-binding protein
MRYTNRGAQMTVFRVAVNQLRTGPEGERQETTEWFRVRVIGRQAEYASRLAKGSRVFVAGRLVIGQYQSREGEQRASYDVFADEVVSVSPNANGRAREGEGEGEPEPVGAGVSSIAAPARARSGGRSGTRGAETTEEMDDLPF